MRIFFHFTATSIFFFPAVFLHEMAHMIFAYLTLSHVKSVSLIPKVIRNEDGAYEFVYGSVEYVPRVDFLGSVAAMAPVFLWYLLYLFLDYVDVLRVDFDLNILTVSVDIIRFLNPKHFWMWIVAVQLYWGGFPSKQDVKVALKYLFSYSMGVVVLTIIAYKIGLFDPIIDLVYNAVFELENLVKRYLA